VSGRRNDVPSWRNDVPNPVLREHVTRVGFDLSLGKTHIAALVWIDMENKRRHHIRMNGAPWNFFVTGAMGLQARGLVAHTPPPRGCDRDKWHLGRSFRITPAGRLVRDLLKEAGIWQEYEAAFPVVESVAS
jgi:hypothetical protein